MANSRPSKRQRTSGPAYHDTLPVFDDYNVIHASEGKLLTIGPHRVAAAPMGRVAQRTLDTWGTASSWAPPDDADFALDPNGDLYDEALERDVMEDAAPLPNAPVQKKKKSMVSRRPHIVWKDRHRQTYLDEIIRWAGRGDFVREALCRDCLARSAATPGLPEYRCDECFLPDLTCSQCCVRRHRMHPFHRIQKWAGDHFINISLKSLGLKIQLNHASMYCVNPLPSHASMLVLHTNGIHDVDLRYCGCERAIPPHIQLLRRGLYPASQLTVKTCVTFRLLEHLHILALTTKASTYDFYRALEKSTNNTGINVPTSRYRALFRTILQWRHLKLLKRGGRGHDVTGAEGTKPGELAIKCPSCPIPGINLPEGWRDVPDGMRFLYMMILCMDANFRLKNQLVSNYSQDPGLGIGWAYMMPRVAYEAYVLSRASDADISTCVGFQALSKANTKFSVGLRYTGVNLVVCGRSEMILPMGVGNLQKGERYANMDYLFALLLQYIYLALLLISYDIACQWFINLFKRMEEHWPEELKLRSGIKLIPAIPKLHEPMHQTSGHQVYSFNYIRGVGHTDGECPERVWGPHNALGNSTKTQGPGSRQDTLDDHFSFWNWLKYINLGVTLLRRYKAAVAERNVQQEGHRGLTESLDSALVQKWEVMCVDWDEDAFPKKKKNPYYTENAYISEAKVRKDLAAEEERRLAEGGVVVHATSAGAFVLMGLELEDTQRRLQRLAKTNNAKLNITTGQERSMTEERNSLRVRLRAWEKLLPIYLPGLLQYQTDLANSVKKTPQPTSDKPEDADLWLPSRIPSSMRTSICRVGLPAIEERLRGAQCTDSLDKVRRVLKVKSRMVHFKNKNVRGQRNGTKSRTLIDRVHDKARHAADKYRAARQAKLALAGPGKWEEIWQVLEDKDIRGYQDPNRLRVRVGRRGVWEDGQLDDSIEAAAPSSSANAATPSSTSLDDEFLYNEIRKRRDGTGETRRTLSWIWLTEPAVGPDDDKDDILRVEWAKSRARAARGIEEVMLLKEEMRRVLAFLDWKANWWKERSEARPGSTKELAEGIASYAVTQSSLQISLATHFRDLWQTPLADVDREEPAATGPWEHDDDDDDDDDEEDGDEDGDVFPVEPLSDDEGDD